MGNSVLLCLLLVEYIRIARARTLKMVPYTKYLLALLVILEASQALPVSQKDEKNVEEEIVIPIDEAKEFKYELNRDQYLQGGINGGQSGLGDASMPDHLQAPDAKAEEEPAVTEEPAPIVNEAYAKRLGGFAQKAALLAGAKRTKIE